MCMKQCGCVLSIILSAIIGIIVGVLFFLGNIANIITFVWIAFGISAVSLILLNVVGTSERNKSYCICKNGSCLLLGAVGSMILSLIALGLTLSIGVISIAILIGFLGLFTALTLVSLFTLTLCVVKSNCRD